MLAECGTTLCTVTIPILRALQEASLSYALLRLTSMQGKQMKGLKEPLGCCGMRKDTQLSITKLGFSLNIEIKKAFF